MASSDFPLSLGCSAAYTDAHHDFQQKNFKESINDLVKKNVPLNCPIAGHDN